MYSIRDDAATGLLTVGVSGRLATAEAARAVSQALALSEAGGRSLILCDLRETTAGPAEPSVVAALIQARKTPQIRVAFVGNATQLRTARRIARAAGLTRQSGVFSQLADAETWLRGRALVKGPRLSATALRHFEQTAGPEREAMLAQHGSAA